MSVHEQFAEDLALYALGALPETEGSALEAHLRECEDCRRELELLRGDMAALSYSLARSAPPQRSRQRLMEAVRREPRNVKTATRRVWPVWVPWVAAATMAGLAVLLMHQNTGLQQQNSGLQQQLSQLDDRNQKQQAQLERAHRIVATLTAKDALRVTLVETKSQPQPQGKAIYVRDRGSLIFLASNFRPAPSGKSYELWLIPTEGNPIPAGVFRPDSRGSATVVNPPLPAGVEAKAFAITIEPEGGSQKPTPPILMTGAGE